LNKAAAMSLDLPRRLATRPTSREAGTQTEALIELGGGKGLRWSCRFIYQGVPMATLADGENRDHR
jgi:hypothetical protein